jgi:DNA topoisomerase I
MDSIEAAREAGLRYIDDRQSGITRRRRGRHFVYYYPDGSPVRDAREVQRIGALAIPPAYTSVWIAPIANGHIQATGRDARGRKQYRYHKRWREVRDEAKYHRLVAFGRVLPKIRTAVAKDLNGEELSRRKVLAAIVAIMDSTGLRVGNEEYVKENGSFGLTTLRARHVRVNGSQVKLRFRGKTRREHSIALDDRRLARIVKRCRDLPGEELFTYVDENGAVSAVSSDDVNEYIRGIAGDDFSAKDFRTWIGNTPAVCRKAYVHPAVIETYARLRELPCRNGKVSGRQRAGALSHRERVALRFVERWERQGREPLERTLERSLKKARR